MNQGFLWRLTYQDAQADRSEPRPGSSDRDYFRALGVDVDARSKRHRTQRRTVKLREAIPASVSVFRALMRRPAGGTVVVLVPRADVPATPGDTVVIDEQRMREAS